MRLGAALIAVATLTAPVAAQWLTLKTPGIPRSADGKPNLTAPAPRTAEGKPDLTGVWMPTAALDTSLDRSAQPWVQDLARKRQGNFFKDRPGYNCLPGGPEVSGGWRRIIQSPTLIAILNEDLSYRQLFMDGRTLEDHPNPSWMGYSVAHWDDDVLVVDSNGFNDRSWLASRGLGHTEALRVQERFRRVDVGHLEQEVNFIDPAAYTKPVTVAMKMQLAADTEMLEAVATGSQSQLHGVLGGPMGGRHADCRKPRFQRSHVARFRRASAYRGTSHHGALSPRSVGRIDLEVTLEDRGAYARPWTVPVDVTLAPDTDLIEYVCNENEQRRTSLVGRSESEKNLIIPISTLSDYVGTYMIGPTRRDRAPVKVLSVRMRDGVLLLDLDGKGSLPLMALSPTSFSTRLVNVEFVRNERGHVTQAVNPQTGARYIRQP